MEDSIFKECIQHYETACKKLCKEPLTIEDFSPKLPDDKKQYLLSVERVTTVIEAKKPAGHEFDWNNEDEEKRFPWWDMETYGDAPAGSGFSLYGVGYGNAHSGVGARLSSLTEADVRLIAANMLEDYRVIMKK